MSYLVEPDAYGLDALATLVKIGELSPHVQAALSLEQAAQAHALISQRQVTGQLVIAVWGHSAVADFP